MNILIIDDEGNEGFSGALKKSLESLFGKQIPVIEDPEIAIDEMSSKYDLVFIDYLFSKNPDILTGAQVGLAIRKKYPLIALVLTTAYGPNHIRDFIFVGFDDYLDKQNEGLPDSDKMKRLQDCISTALSNSQKRIKSQFEESELKTTRLRLCYIKKILEQISNKPNFNQTLLAIKVYEAMTNDGITVGKTYNALSVFFKLKDKDGNYTENALKARQIFKAEYDEWKSVMSSYNPLKIIKAEFRLGKR